MNTTEEIAIIEKAKHLEAENESLKSILQEYQQVAMLRNIEKRDLEEKASEGAAAKSSFDQQTEELKHIRDYIFELKQQAEAAAQRENELENQVSIAVSSSYQLEDIRTKYNYLQVQLDDLSERLQQLNRQNSIQSLYTGRIAELESMLANAEDEITALKDPPKEDN
jgi:predicted  nucleic acid-binding Zn-ribbon protein